MSCVNASGCGTPCVPVPSRGLLPPGSLPESTIKAAADGLEIRAITLPVAGIAVPQHVHDHDHVTLIAHGSVLVEQNGVFFGVFKAPEMLRIAAHMPHSFKSLENETVLYCIHNVSRTGTIEIDHDAAMSGVS